jgi:hypothetical protein
MSGSTEVAIEKPSLARIPDEYVLIAHHELADVGELDDRLQPVHDLAVVEAQEGPAGDVLAPVRSWSNRRPG